MRLPRANRGSELVAPVGGWPGDDVIRDPKSGNAHFKGAEGYPRKLNSMGFLNQDGGVELPGSFVRLCGGATIVMVETPVI